uniref:RAVE complex protein Rav1 C-terminal domain-containing protein n=1 Tax=Ciona intestinalis TaxID=7719 RepID=H2XV65_CIOIN
MKQHQVLTGSSNPGNHCYDIGQISNFTFFAYGSGCDVVISSSSKHPLQILTYKDDVVVSALSCSENNGYIAVAYAHNIVLYWPQRNSINHTYTWSQKSSFVLDENEGHAKILSWNYDGSQLLTGSSMISLWKSSSDDEDEEGSSSWSCAWKSGSEEHPIELSFSPTNSASQLFASVTDGDCMIKVWFPHRKKDNRDIDFTFTYLLHPQPVVGFEWRKNFVSGRFEIFSNVLISSSRDQICRIWCETKSPTSQLLKFQSKQPTHQSKMGQNLNQPRQVMKAATAPAMSSLTPTPTSSSGKRVSENRHFHLAASINPLSDIPLLPSAGEQRLNSNNDTQVTTFTIHWLNNKFHQSRVLQNQLLQQVISSHNILEEEGLTMSSSDSSLYLNAPEVIEKLVYDWIESRDALFSIHPADGSLLVWHIDWLDENRPGRIRQPQVCFSSRIPMAFSSGDAATLCPNVILFVNFSTQQNLLHSASCFSLNPQQNSADVSTPDIVYTDVQLLSKHTDGSLNLWQVSFSDENDFSSIMSIYHITRICGHCFHLSGILSHPILPLLLTTASHQVASPLKPSEESDLILWRVDPVGPLSFCGGLSELTRISNDQHSFTHVSWFPVLFPAWCLGRTNNSPSTALIAIGKDFINIYQALVDADAILTEINAAQTISTEKPAKRNLVSQQSSAHPGCLLHLLNLQEKVTNGGNMLLLETFPDSAMCGSETTKTRNCHFQKSFFIVIVEQNEQAVIHTWKVTFKASLSSVKELRSRRTTVRMSDSSDDDSVEDDVEDESTSFSFIDVSLDKISSENIQLPHPSAKVLSACSGTGRFDPKQKTNVYNSPFHVCTACDDDNIYFWCYSATPNPVTGHHWNIWSADNSPGGSVRVEGRPIIIKAANPTLLACLHNNLDGNFMVTVYECASSGGSNWMEQDRIQYDVEDACKEEEFHLDWLSREEGSFFLAVGYARNIKIYSLSPNDIKGKSKKEKQSSNSFSPISRQVSLDAHTRQKLFASSKLKSAEMSISWARDGILVVATQTEMYVFCPWMEQDKQSTKSDMMSLSEIADKACPTLPQYHPLVLSELMNSGHMAVVREILINLAICINGEFHDTVCQSEVLQVEKYHFADSMINTSRLCTTGNNITPLALNSLLADSGHLQSNFTKKEESSSDPVGEAQKNMDEESDEELNDILGIKSSKKRNKTSREQVDLASLEPNYFGKEHCKVIHEFLVRNQLPGLSSLDQMELMALADTLEMTNASNLHSNSPSNEGGGGSLDNCGLQYVMALHNHLCLLNSLPSVNRAVLLKQGLDSCHFAWAFHSEAEDEMLSMLPSVHRGSPEWKELKSLGVGWWIRSNVLLRRLIEQTARAAFLKNNDPLDSALFYLALQKKAVLCGLFKSVKDTRMYGFFQNNFREERWRVAALKNAFALMGKQRFQQAAAFFLLSGSVHDAVEVCIEKLKDIQLALVIARMHPTNTVSEEKLLLNHVLGENDSSHTVNTTTSDSFLRSMSYWILGRYKESVTTLVENVRQEDITDIFNFYMFLRNHPIVQRSRAVEAASSPTTNQPNISENERGLIFQTAVVHLEAGCPVLTLDSLSNLPNKEIKSASPDVVTPVKEEVQEVPDWSAPVDLGDDGGLDLYWSEDDDDDMSDKNDPDVPTITIQPCSPPQGVPHQDNEQVELAAFSQDIFANHLRMTACLKIFVQELQAIANAYNMDGGQLRSKLYMWLENASKQVGPLHHGSSSDEEASNSIESMSNRASGLSLAPSLHELILADNQDWKSRRSALTRRHKWLQRNHNFIRTLLSYCNLHDSAFGSLAALRMELLLLLQESLQDQTSPRHLASPLPLPSANIPLISSIASSCKSVIADPLTHLCHMTHDILRAILHFVQAPHPTDNSQSYTSTMLCCQAAALSSCIYQSLCDTSSSSYRSKLFKVDTSMEDSHPPRNQAPDVLTYIPPTTAPSQWPGVPLLQSLLNSQASSGENRTKIIVLLTEATASVYISLVIHALRTHNASLLYRLTNHNLGTKMWNAVFGGGVRQLITYSTPHTNPEVPTKSVQKMRDRLNSKVLLTMKRLSIGSSGHQSSSTKEKFVPPEISLWDWFLTKPFTSLSNDAINFDSDADVEEEEEEESDTYSALSDPIDDVAASDQLDPDSYSWKILRLVIVQTVIKSLKGFLSLAGLDINEISANSSLLAATLRILQDWLSEAYCALEESSGPPTDFLPSFQNSDSNFGGPRPAMLRYQAMLEPNNTPFHPATSKTTGLIRLWHSLVKKEELQETFIKYIYLRKNKTEEDTSDTGDEFSTHGSSFSQKVKILHKEPDIVTAFCMNSVNKNCIALSSSKEVIELDLSMLLASDAWAWVEEASTPMERTSSVKDDEEFLFVSTPKPGKTHPVMYPQSAQVSIPWQTKSLTGQGANVLLKRARATVRRLESHPTLPYYLTGSADGSLCMWEWGHQHRISQYRAAGQFAKVSSVHFNLLGNKLSLVDGEGFLTLWQVSSPQKSFFHHLVHDRGASDCCFLSSASVIATAGLSTSHRNVAIWDTLMPKRSMLVKDFLVHEQTGSYCLKYLPRYRSILVGGKNGVVAAFDDRSMNEPLAKFIAHDSAIKCLSVDPHERIYATGSTSGDVKIWDATSNQLLSACPNEHTRSSLFRNFGFGTVQISLTDDQIFTCGADGSLKMKILPKFKLR